MPQVNKPKGKWWVKSERTHYSNDECPFIFYPRNDTSCRLRRHHVDDICSFANCSLMKWEK